jgi:hypothetical protein
MYMDLKFKYLIVTQNIDGTAHMQKFKTGKNVESYFNEYKTRLNNNPLARIIIYRRGTKYLSWRTDATRGCNGDPELIRVYKELRGFFPGKISIPDFTCGKFQRNPNVTQGTEE